MEEQGKEHRVRIYDIAEELGLSTATVSNVIHGKTKKISDKTVKRVMALLEKRQYFPGVADILLAQNDSRIIGVFVNDHEKYEGHTLKCTPKVGQKKFNFRRCIFNVQIHRGIEKANST